MPALRVQIPQVVNCALRHNPLVWDESFWVLLKDPKNAKVHLTVGLGGPKGPKAHVNVATHEILEKQDGFRRHVWITADRHEFELDYGAQMYWLDEMDTNARLTGVSLSKESKAMKNKRTVKPPGNPFALKTGEKGKDSGARDNVFSL